MSNALPPIPDKYKDRVLTHDPNALLPTPDVDLALTGDSDHPLEAPVGVAISGQVIGALYASRATPFEFMQFLLERFKEVGAPVERSPRGWRLARGKVFKLKSKPGDPDFRYVWVSDSHAAAMGVETYAGVQ